jgi:hypothetical protein
VAKFSGPTVRTARPTQASIRTTGQPLRTHEGGTGWARTPESELFLLAAANFVGEDSFYESAGQRDSRFVRLIHEVARSNPAFIAGDDNGRCGLAEFLRSKLQMRSAALVMAAEYIKAGGPNGRSVLRRVIQRGDEPAEALGYWLSTHGRKLPKPLKRGIADATVALYTERNALKYDGQSRAVRMGDVVDLTHPEPKAEWQNALFRFLLDHRHDRADTPPPILQTITLDRRLQGLPEGERRVALRDGQTARAGWSWERLSGWLPGGMDAEAWEAVIPTMGYMATLRNLRNFDEARVAPTVKEAIRNRLADPGEVAASRQLPYRFWSAYKFAPSLEWASALEAALNLTVENIPALPGRTLVLIDISGSMASTVSKKSKVVRWEVGALFGAAQARKADNADMVLFASTSEAVPVHKSTSVLRFVDEVGRRIGSIGYGTMIHESIRRHWAGHDRIVVFTDEQGHDSYSADMNKIPAIHTVNLAGYRAATMATAPGRYSYGGFTDAFFTVMALLERGASDDWPF